jgi:hypothetical protein
MTLITHLWLPILVAAVLVFVASSLIHMVFKWHNSDYTKLANEDEVAAALRAGSAKPGLYVIPHCADMKDLKSEAMQKKFREGPIGFITIAKSGMPGMGKQLLLWFLYIVAVTSVGACLALQIYGLQAEPHHAGHVVGMLSLLAYIGGSIQNGIWMAKPWSSVAKDVLDGLIYATVTALTFMWLWP